MVIVYMHWGREFGLHPDRKRLLMTKYLYSLGITAVIGAHSHILQSHSLTNEHFVAYSLGNFLFPLLSACLTVSVKFQFYRFVLKQDSASYANNLFHRVSPPPRPPNTGSGETLFGYGHVTSQILGYSVICR